MKRKTAWSALTEKSAEHLLLGFKKAAALKFEHMVLQGDWLHGRRFVIVGGRPSVDPFPQYASNPLTLTLALPLDIDAVTLTSRCRSFGGQVERMWRDSQQRFEHVVSAFDTARHIVPAYHHVALCGHKPERWLLDNEVVPSVTEANSCPKCATAAITRPRHGARWHPLARQASP